MRGSRARFFAVITAGMLGILIALGLTPCASAQTADLILSNGKVLTVDKEFTLAQAVAIRGGRILAVGSDQAVIRHRSSDTRVIDLKGKTVIPGLIDNHFHFVRSAWNHRREIRIDGVRSRKDVLDMISARAKTVPEGTWISIIGGWSPAQFADGRGGFSLDELDRAAPRHPLYIQQSYRAVYANSLALTAAGLEPSEGAMRRGRRAFRPFAQFVGWRGKVASEQDIRAYMAVLNSVGLTTVYDVGRPSEGDLAPVEKVAAAGPMPLRVFYTLRYRADDARDADEIVSRLDEGGVRPLHAGPQFGLVGLGEHLYGPMHDSANRRDPWPEDVWGPVRRIATAAARRGWPIHEHTMSDATVSQFLDLVQEIAADTPKVKTLRWTLAHVVGISRADVSRAADLGVALAVHSQAMMSGRDGNRPPLGSIDRSGVLWGLGSDGAIVAPINPFLTLGWAVTGRNIGGEATWTSDQRVSRKAALIAHTRSNAQLLFKEDELGSLEPGKRADLVVIDRDYLTVPEDEIAAIRPVLTITDGRIVFDSR